MISKFAIFWVITASLLGTLLIAGLIHLAFRSSAQLYLNMRDTDEKQTQHIFALEKQVAEIERKLSVFEQHIKYEAQK